MSTETARRCWLTQVGTPGQVLRSHLGGSKTPLLPEPPASGRGSLLLGAPALPVSRACLSLSEVGWGSGVGGLMGWGKDRPLGWVWAGIRRPPSLSGEASRAAGSTHKRLRYEASLRATHTLSLCPGHPCQGSRLRELTSAHASTSGQRRRPSGNASSSAPSSPGLPLVWPAALPLWMACTPLCEGPAP